MAGMLPYKGCIKIMVLFDFSTFLFNFTSAPLVFSDNFVVQPSLMLLLQLGYTND